MVRKALDRLGEFYKTGLGQDVIETGTGAVLSAGGQALFTDMSPEEIAMSTGLGIGAAAIGRPLIGGLGQRLGTRFDNRNPGVRNYSQGMLDHLHTGNKYIDEAMAAKLAPYRDLGPTAQLGQLFGRGYGDNVMQALVALAAPSLFANGDEE